MLCENCNKPMQWRSTNTETHIAKYKCPHCGQVQTITVEIYEPPIVEKKPPKNYYCRNGSFVVRKRKEGKQHYIGTFGNEETAKKVVAEMVKCDWDKNMLPVIYSRLNIHREGKSWVCA